jgi:hypothetical protein
MLACVIAQMLFGNVVVLGWQIDQNVQIKLEHFTIYSAATESDLYLHVDN